MPDFTIHPVINFVLGPLMVLFGVFRLRMGLRRSRLGPSAIRRKGMDGLKPRTHYVFGSLYILAGVALVVAAIRATLM